MATSVSLHTDVNYAFSACLDSDFHFGCVHPKVLKQYAGPQSAGRRDPVTGVPYLTNSFSGRLHLEMNSPARKTWKDS